MQLKCGITLIIGENYNRFLNHSYPYVKHKWVLITNNDVRYERGWFSKIIEVYNKRPDVESFSPKCPILYSKYFFNAYLTCCIICCFLNDAGVISPSTK